MNDTNIVVEVGRLTRDLGERDFAYTPAGTARANISIAVNRSKKQGEQWVDETSFFDITLWGKTAENLRPYLTKGKQICVEGHLKQDRWEKDGQKQSRISIVADNVQLLGGRFDSSQSGGTSYQQSQPSFTPRTQGQTYTLPADMSGDEFPEDIPF
ncbi:MAG: single-stranded DNA-binding protein [Treponema sp.]|nr:single-stranded DNA-binding protein [Treponema sp.]